MNGGWAWTQWLDVIDANATVQEMTELVRTATVAENFAIARYQRQTEAQR